MSLFTNEVEANVKAIAGHFLNDPPKNEQAKAQAAKFFAWYNALGWSDYNVFGQTTLTAAIAYRNAYNAFQGYELKATPMLSPEEQAAIKNRGSRVTYSNPLENALFGDTPTTFSNPLINAVIGTPSSQAQVVFRKVARPVLALGLLAGGIYGAKKVFGFTPVGMLRKLVRK